MESPLRPQFGASWTAGLPRVGFVVLCLSALCSSQGASLAQPLAFRMGLGIGRQVRASFRPTAETLHEPRPSGHIPSHLRDKLVSVTKELSERLEAALDEVAANAGGPHSLWGAYKQVSWRRASQSDHWRRAN